MRGRNGQIGTPAATDAGVTGTVGQATRRRSEPGHLR
jgi:hypothetical protein